MLKECNMRSKIGYYDWAIQVENIEDLRLVASVFPKIDMENGKTLFEGFTDYQFLLRPNDGAWGVTLYEYAIEDGLEIFSAKDFYNNWYRILSERAEIIHKPILTAEEEEKLKDLSKEISRFYVYTMAPEVKELLQKVENYDKDNTK